MTLLDDDKLVSENDKFKCYINCVTEMVDKRTKNKLRCLLVHDLRNSDNNYVVFSNKKPVYETKSVEDLGCVIDFYIRFGEKVFWRNK